MSLWSELKRRNVLRVAAAYLVVGWLILQVASILFDFLAVPDWAGKLLIAVLVLGFIPTLVVTWVFDITPEGVKLEKELGEQHHNARSASRLDLVTIAAVVLLAIITFWQLFTQPQREAAEPASTGHDVAQAESPAAQQELPFDPPEGSIAVLPFANLSADPDNEYFSDGIAEEILNQLVKLEPLMVSSRTSSFRYRGDVHSIEEIGRALNVGHVLEGSVRRSAGRVRITTQLIDAREGFQLWSETYDRELSDIFAIQDDITRQVVDELAQRLGVEQAIPTESTGLTHNQEAYDLYLQGRHFWRQRNAAALQTAVERLERSVQVDPLFARAWSNLAAAWLVVPTYNHNMAEGPAMEKAQVAADRALSIDPRMAEALSVQGYLQFHACRWQDAERSFIEAKSLDSKDPAAHHWHALLLSSAGRNQAALDSIRQAYALDPNNAAIAHVMGMLLDTSGATPEADPYYSKAAELGFFAHSRWFNGLTLARTGDWQGAEEIWRQQAYPLAQVPDPVTLNLALLAAMRDPAKRGDFTRQVLVAWQQSQLTFRGALHLLVVAGEQNVDMLFEDNLCHEDLFYLWDANNTGHLASPRLYQALQGMHLPEYWSVYGWPDECRALDQSQAECPAP